jgi:hypothetical protein
MKTEWLLCDLGEEQRDERQHHHHQGN